MKRLLLALALIGAACAGVATSGNSVERPFHIVQQGETWRQIATEHGVTADALQLANDRAVSTTDTSFPRVGWYLVIPVPGPPTTTTTTTTVAATTTTTQPATTTTAPPTTTVPPATTTTAPATTTSTAPSTTTTTSPPVTTTTAPSGSPDFLATFSSPGDFYDRFQLDVHFRDVVSSSGDSVGWDRALSGDHNMNCEGPTTQRTFHPRRAHDMPGDNSGDDHRNSELFWWCAPAGPDSGHVMTGMGDVDGYTILSFSPNRSFTNVKRVCWDVNPTNISERKWYGVAVIPESQYQATGRRLDYVGDPGVDEFALNPADGGYMFLFQDQNFRSFYNPPGGSGLGYDPMGVRDEGAEFNVYGDVATRNKHCLIENANGTVTIEQYRGANRSGAGADGYRRQTVTGSFPDQARVIFLDDSYTPGKDEGAITLTWHWDNITVDAG